VVRGGERGGVTVGAPVAGSEVVRGAVASGAAVRVVDDLSSGKVENIQRHVDEGVVAFLDDDLRRPGAAERAVEGMNVVFHLAADHGGRGYVDLNQAACASNLALDGNVFLACRAAGVDKIVY